VLNFYLAILQKRLFRRKSGLEIVQGCIVEPLGNRNNKAC
jgi:hypothetical protein